MNTQEIQDAFNAMAPEGGRAIMGTGADGIRIAIFAKNNKELGARNYTNEQVEAMKPTDEAFLADLEEILPLTDRKSYIAEEAKKAAAAKASAKK